jgi:regulator of replication initiation timing
MKYNITHMNQRNKEIEREFNKLNSHNKRLREENAKLKDENEDLKETVDKVTIYSEDIHVSNDQVIYSENVLDIIITTYDVILLLDVRYPTLRVRRQLKNIQPPA